jgi:hypothetical protein
MALQLLPGEFAFETFLTERYITAVGGGGRTSGAIHTDATTPGAWETFRPRYGPGSAPLRAGNPEGFLSPRNPDRVGELHYSSQRRRSHLGRVAHQCDGAPGLGDVRAYSSGLAVIYLPGGLRPAASGSNAPAVGGSESAGGYWEGHCQDPVTLEGAIKVTVPFLGKILSAV